MCIDVMQVNLLNELHKETDRNTMKKKTIEEIRETVIDYYGTAVNTVSPLAVLDVINAEHMSDEQLIETAVRNGLITEDDISE